MEESSERHGTSVIPTGALFSIDIFFRTSHIVAPRSITYWPLHSCPVTFVNSARSLLALKGQIPPNYHHCSLVIKYRLVLSTRWLQLEYAYPPVPSTEEGTDIALEILKLSSIGPPPPVALFLIRNLHPQVDQRIQEALLSISTPEYRMKLIGDAGLCNFLLPRGYWSCKIRQLQLGVEPF